MNENPLIFHPEALEELQFARKWYENAVPGLGSEFIRCVIELTERIVRHPRMYADLEAGYRRAFLRRFPYQLVYKLHQNRIIVLVAALYL